MNNAPTTVLIIEDHPLMRSALCAAIAEGSDLALTAMASNSQDVPHIVETLRPSLIVFSVGNPGWREMFAITLLHHAHPGIPILALITNEVPDQERVALNYGAQAVLTKSASRAELLNSLRNLQKDILKDGTSTLERQEREETSI